MTEYIKREAAYNAIVNNYDTDAMLRDLDAIPAADVVPIVRCKDCKYVEIIERDWGDAEMYCMSRGSCCFPVIARDYCSRAERLEAEGEQ